MDQNILLEQQVWNEEAIMELLGVNRRQLDYLRREKGLPCVRLGQRIRVYLANEVLDYIRKQSGRLS
ncbi:MAG TPA: helix-turn-helix domain-containing protein [Dehalococcoidia bacterium]|nr:helix-turn-helix domain-containing protein [Dehalococcoidia bacterium]